MHNKKLKVLFIFLITLIIFFIVFYKILFYIPPLLDYGKRNFTEKTIDFLCFGWHFTNASICIKYLKNNKEANKELGKAAWYRKRYLVKKFEVDGEDLSSVLEVYKNLNINSIKKKLYVFLIKKENNELNFLREAGENFISWKNWKMAAEVLSKAADSNPDDIMSNYYLGQCHLKSKRLSKANQCFEKVIKLKSDFADAYFRLGFIAEKKKNWNKAQSYYEKTISILPNHLECLKALKKINRKIRD
ncbi:MAG: tetratricopeptide repeat protein [Candidatus Aminicenantes bacterium]|nr:tetratricopeptide repeat protein [Candidatus Aminicenantes bacterium]